MDTVLKNQLLKAIKLAQDGHWDAPHRIVQDYKDTASCWIHAVLHKIEGDESNSRYWYARCDTNFEDYADTSQELDAIEDFLIWYNIPMLRRYFTYFIFALLFALTQQAAVTHEISHIADTQQNSKKQEKTTHLNFCEKCMNYGELANGIAAKHFNINLPTFNFTLNSFIAYQHTSIRPTVYAARAPPSNT